MRNARKRKFDREVRQAEEKRRREEDLKKKEEKEKQQEIQEKLANAKIQEEKVFMLFQNAYSYYNSAILIFH